MSETTTPPLTFLPFDAGELSQVVAEVLSMFGEVPPHDVTALGVHDDQHARVVLHGEGAVEMLLAAPAPAAAALAEAYFGEVTSASDLTDAMGELSNVMGGAIKPFLEGVWVIGIPEPGVSTMDATEGLITASAFFGGGPLTVTVAPLTAD